MFGLDFFSLDIGPLPFAPPDDYLRYSFVGLADTRYLCFPSSHRPRLHRSSYPYSFSMHSIHSVSHICSSFFHVHLSSPRLRAVLCCHICRIIRGRRGPSTSAVQCIPTHPYTAPLTILLLLLLQYCFSVRRLVGPSSPSVVLLSLWYSRCCSNRIECQIYCYFLRIMRHFGGLCISRSRPHCTPELEMVHGSGITQDYGYVR
ncbi:hypothetical protein C8Q74DRAFT_314098 [Fomes fomentarius]|nr:hypothetical protein C8Q74DRAFT_314098 [Fomes fomentarius]